MITTVMEGVNEPKDREPAVGGCLPVLIHYAPMTDKITQPAGGAPDGPP